VAWLDEFAGDLVALDTAPLIYFLEASPRYASIVNPFFQAVDRGTIRIVTSTITLIEVLVHPLRMGNAGIAQQYRTALLNATGVSVLPLSPAIAEVAARLRADYEIGTPDAIQLATAISTGARALFTNDARIPRSTGVKILLVDEILREESDSAPQGEAGNLRSDPLEDVPSE
jgi:predicted nucleic acid-binding protein